MIKNRYLPFKEAREFARDLNIDTAEKWEQYATGKLAEYEPIPDNIPKDPQAVYRRTGFKNYKDWLSSGYMDFNEAKEFVKTLELSTDKQWYAYCKGEFEELPAKPRNIPRDPNARYRKVWTGWNDWLNSTQMRDYGFTKEWRSFEEAREFIRSLNLYGQIEWRKYCKNELPSHQPKPRDIPASPDVAYQEKWIDMGDWLGNGRKRRGNNKTLNNTWLPYKEAREFVQSLNLVSAEQWTDYTNGKIEELPKKPTNIPMSPWFVYEDNGWTGLEDWLGNITRRKVKDKLPFEEAREFIRSLNLKDTVEWIAYAKGEIEYLDKIPDNIPKAPQKVYKDNGWNGIRDWIGTNISSATQSDESELDIIIDQPIKNILSLYNPYYNANVIEQHIELLKQNSVVAFGKVRSKLRNYDNPHQVSLDNIYNNVSIDKPMQLFLTDYSSIYVANVIEVVEDTNIKVPTYYEELDVEHWFIFDDLRVIIHKDFEVVRDSILSNFKAVDFNNSTYAIYGNSYVYPMEVTMKKEVNYFKKSEKEFKYYLNIFKTQEELDIQKTLIDFSFGTKRFYNFTPNTQDNIISAELEFMQNRDNLLYDFSSIVLKYSKAVEFELYRFMKVLISFIIEKDEYISTFKYQINRREFDITNILYEKPNYGTYLFLLKSHEIKDVIKQYIYHGALLNFMFNTIPFNIKTVQDIRNESIHGSPASYAKCKELREEVIGIGKNSIIAQLDKFLKNIV